MAIESREPAAADDADLPAAPRGPQFSLGHLLAAMGVLSVICAGLFGLPEWLSAGFVIVAAVLLSAATTSAIVYGRDSVRAFYLGAACPLLLVLAAVVVVFVILAFEANPFEDFDDFAEELEQFSGGLRTSMIFGIVTAPFCGAVSLLVRWRLHARR